MSKNGKISTDLSTFRRAAAKALRESNQGFEGQMSDPPVDFYLISNIVATGNPKSTFDTATSSTVKAESSELKTETVIIKRPPIPMPKPIKQNVTSQSNPLLIQKMDTPRTSPRQPQIVDQKAPCTSLPENILLSWALKSLCNSLTSPILESETDTVKSLPIPMPKPNKKNVTSQSNPLLIQKMDTPPTSSRQQQIGDQKAPCTSIPENILPPLSPESWVDRTRRLELSRARLLSRIATVSEAAASATIAAQDLQVALDAIAHNKGGLLRMPEIETSNDQRRKERNKNLLNSALKIIEKMDPAYLEVLCYAIHDIATKNEFF